METLKQLASTFIGKVLVGVIIFLIGTIIALSFHTLIVSGERNVLEQTVKTKEAETARQEAETARQKDNVTFYKLWMERDKLDAKVKDAEFKRTMSAKPKFITSIKYVPTGDKCVDYDGIINEVRSNKKAQGESL